MIIDTHSHLHGPEFESDLAETLARAAAANVGLITLVGVDTDDVDRALAFARANNPPPATSDSPTPSGPTPHLRVVAGVHPNHALAWDLTAEARLRDQQLLDPLVVAVGECGLDYHYDFAPRDRQRIAFQGQLELSRALAKPIVIHCREAYDDLMPILADFGRPAWATGESPVGVLHCFFGTPQQAEQAIDLGWMIGIGGSSTFKKAEDVHEAIRLAALTSLVLETDAPYMAPTPHRGKRNEPAYLTRVVERIAELKNLSTHEVEATTTQNALRLYRLQPGDFPA